MKEVSVAVASGMILSLIIFGFNLFVNHHDMMISITISVALLSVIIIAAMIGTIVPIFLNKNKIDPAIATGPFITTSNDILGVMVYFTMSIFICFFLFGKYIQLRNSLVQKQNLVVLCLVCRLVLSSHQAC